MNERGEIVEINENFYKRLYIPSVAHSCQSQIHQPVLNIEPEELEPIDGEELETALKHLKKSKDSDESMLNKCIEEKRIPDSWKRAWNGIRKASKSTGSILIISTSQMIWSYLAAIRPNIRRCSKNRVISETVGLKMNLQLNLLNFEILSLDITSLCRTFFIIPFMLESLVKFVCIT